MNQPIHCQSKLEQPTLRPLPAIATRVINVCNDAESGSIELINVMQSDPVISLRLLQVANSPMYGFSGEVRSVDQAVVILGMKAVRDLVVSAAAAILFEDRGETKEARRRLWNHSLGCATVASQLAQRLGIATKEEAFLSGVLHDVGKLVFYDMVPEEYAAQQIPINGSTVVWERETFGTAHTELGLRCVEHWGLPAEIVSAIGYHHEPVDANVGEDLVALIALANSLSKAWAIGSENQDSGDPEEIVEQSNLEVAIDSISEIESAAAAEFAAVCRACEC